jgi:hypothetical protein
MSTPQDDPGNRNDDARGWNPPGNAGQDGRQDGRRAAGADGGPGGGQDGRYGQQHDAGTYGHQAARPSYAYPSTAAGPGDTGAAGKGPAPREVMRAYYLILAAGALYLVSTITSTLTTEVPAMAGASVGVGLSVVFAVVFAAIYVVLAVFIRRGQNWARITATVLASLNVVSTVGTLLLLPLAARALEAGGQSMPETPVLSIALGLLVTALGVAGVVMTYLKPARPYFAPQRLGY